VEINTSEELSYVEEKELLHFINGNYEPSEIYTDDQLRDWIRNYFEIYDLYNDDELLEAYQDLIN
jgi:hypothetical protein